MANNKFSGFQPKYKDGVKSTSLLDTLNPYEFRKGMDYELTELGCLRLKESTPEEREKATEKVLKNLQEYGGYYTSLITYETLFRNSEKKPSFKSWLKEQEANAMNVVDDTVKGFDLPNTIASSAKDTNKHHKMSEPKYDKKEYTVTNRKTSPLKENRINQLKNAIKSELRSVLKEQDDLDIDMDSDAADKAATKAAKKASKKGKKGKDVEPKKSANRFDNEIKALENLLWKGDDPESEHTKNDPAEGTLLHTRTKEWDEHKEKRDSEGLTIKDWEARLKELNTEIGEKEVEKHVSEWGPVTDENPKAAGNEGATKDTLLGDDFFQTVKNLEKRIDAVKKEKEEDIKKSLEETKEFAQYQMERADHIRLLEIIKEGGISLREGTDNVRPYYEIAKSAYLEGLSKGLKI